jgi:photosystem II CP43 chlorophyll apoprotein
VPGGEITDIYSYFIISILHLISSGALALGGVYHAIFGPERLEETYYGNIFGYQWQDRFRITAILGAHLITLGFSSLLLQTKSTYFGGLYDTWASGGGDVQLIKYYTISLNPYVLARYLARAPYGNEGWIISINTCEDLVGGHYWVALYLILGDIYHIQTRPLAIIVRGFTWSGEAYLSYSLSAKLYLPLQLQYIHGTITLHTQVNSMVLRVQKLLKHKGLHFWYVTAL